MLYSSSHPLKIWVTRWIVILHWRKLNVCSSNSTLVYFWLEFAHFFWSATVLPVHFIKDSLFPGQFRCSGIKAPKYVGWPLHLVYNSLAVMWSLLEILYLNKYSKSIAMAQKSDWMSHIQSRCKIADMGALLKSFEFLTHTVLSTVVLISLLYRIIVYTGENHLQMFSLRCLMVTRMLLSFTKTGSVVIVN